MSKIVLVTGGARSGKSNFAEKLCIDQNNSTAYIATSIPFDDEMKDRVKKHKESRPQNWNTYEIYKDIYSIIKEISNKHETVILDCVTLLVNNLMFTYDMDIDKANQEEINELEKYIKDQVKKLIEEIKKTNLYFVVVTNELGMAVVPDNKLSRVYTDIVGRINQQIASQSDEVYFVVSGIPMKIKG
ncbi:bifunctional adenosylcobinamide kinase/adenosylcobinamide-phosphate guanylyltransferase [Romboutsia lituseburensis]|uniref:Adenosylcobinamide kinase n=1 Tax=Romboutsia lituseburensis DSM 797 TaxID=1121325 RepID=A0A1G9UBI0_9FIRM|nr:bifunctional adenosylcobinamide kinase/adenosylcobinamide-phosphate guanylyltransferase [Romboutsia lituseburensis]CEH35844.1 Bifunctional adenosylcobalamin biosynthesis protein CobU [Romboutsia lituseburensis]SDM57320.1 adenosylcobinamide kinase /adenosylcobinamide-phosphate guanylyltransferase [Romboutsia lituseburensis DSM 797]